MLVGGLNPYLIDPLGFLRKRSPSVASKSTASRKARVIVQSQRSGPRSPELRTVSHGRNSQASGSVASRTAFISPETIQKPSIFSASRGGRPSFRSNRKRGVSTNTGNRHGPSLVVAPPVGH